MAAVKTGFVLIVLRTTLPAVSNMSGRHRCISLGQCLEIRKKIQLPPCYELLFFLHFVNHSALHYMQQFLLNHFFGRPNEIGDVLRAGKKI